MALQHDKNVEDSQTTLVDRDRTGNSRTYHQVDYQASGVQPNRVLPLQNSSDAGRNCMRCVAEVLMLLTFRDAV